MKHWSDEGFPRRGRVRYMSRFMAAAGLVAGLAVVTAAAIGRADLPTGAEAGGDQ